MFDEELFLQIAKEMGMEVSFDGGKDIVDGEEVDVMKIILEPFNKTIEDMAEEYIANNNKIGDDKWNMKVNKHKQ